MEDIFNLDFIEEENHFHTIDMNVLTTVNFFNEDKSFDNYNIMNNNNIFLNENNNNNNLNSNNNNNIINNNQRQNTQTLDNLEEMNINTNNNLLSNNQQFIDTDNKINLIDKYSIHDDKSQRTNSSINQQYYFHTENYREFVKENSTSNLKREILTKFRNFYLERINSLISNFCIKTNYHFDKFELNTNEFSQKASSSHIEKYSSYPIYYYILQFNDEPKRNLSEVDAQRIKSNSQTFEHITTLNDKGINNEKFYDSFNDYRESDSFKKNLEKDKDRFKKTVSKKKKNLNEKLKKKIVDDWVENYKKVANNFFEK